MKVSTGVQFPSNETFIELTLDLLILKDKYWRSIEVCFWGLHAPRAQTRFVTGRASRMDFAKHTPS
jgi:hypothetical protein